MRMPQSPCLKARSSWDAVMYPCKGYPVSCRKGNPGTYLGGRHEAGGMGVSPCNKWYWHFSPTF